MALSVGLYQRQSQSLVMTPQLMQSIQLLQMSHAELLQFIAGEVERNPLLDLSSGAEDEEGDAPSPPPQSPFEDGPDGDRSGEPPEIRPGMDQNFDEAYAVEEMPARAASAELQESWVSMPASGQNEAYEPDDFSAGPLSLQAHIATQLPFLLADPRDRLIADALCELLEDSGYIDAAQIAPLEARLGLQPGQAEPILEKLQTLDPSGIFARSLAECLSIQLRLLDRLDPMMQALLRHLDLLGKRDFVQLRRICRASEEDLVAMLADIRRLNPKPGASFGGGMAETVTADVIVRAGSDGSWLVDLNPATLPRVLVNQSYHRAVSARPMKAGEDQSFLANCLQTANWLVRSLDQRARTILKVSEEIVRQQDAFLLHGVDQLRPLTLKAVADTIGVHESTVSRVTSNKYMETPRGVFELKYFFTVSIASADGGDSHSAEAVRARIRAMIAEESPADVLSDDDIVLTLGKSGIKLARRTVAKYREAMNIASSVQRRREKQAQARLSAF